jgi:hypothetical protein
VTVDVGRLDETMDRPFEIMADGPYEPPPTARLTGFDCGVGYRWIRLRRSNAA